MKNVPAGLLRIIDRRKSQIYCRSVYAGRKNDGDLLSVKRLKAALEEADSAIEILWVALKKGQLVSMITRRIHKQVAEKKRTRRMIMSIDAEYRSTIPSMLSISTTNILRRP